MGQAGVKRPAEPQLEGRQKSILTKGVGSRVWEDGGVERLGLLLTCVCCLERMHLLLVRLAGLGYTNPT